MRNHRFELEPYKGLNTRYRCPNCDQGRSFTRYIDKGTGAHIHPSVGMCNHKDSCNYHYPPNQYFRDNNIPLAASLPKVQQRKYSKFPPEPISCIPVEIFKASLNPAAFRTNHFVKFLIDQLGVDIASQAATRYCIGTSKQWNGSTVFWQVDTNGKVRTGKIMLYSPDTGKRVKEPYDHITWVHSALKRAEYHLKQCLFGEILLIGNTMPVAVVESEKTAVIASVYLPEFIWVAIGSLTNLNPHKCGILKGRNVTLFPDLSNPKPGDLTAFEMWSIKAKELSHIASFQVSDLLERKATEAERKQGLDIADYLIKNNHPSQLAV